MLPLACLVKGSTAGRQVWAPMHWVDSDKVPERWREGQYPKDILRYNRLTSAAARAGNLTVFDTYNLTRGGATLDGVHVPAPVSLAKLQLLLGIIEARHSASAAAMSAALQDQSAATASLIKFFGFLPTPRMTTCAMHGGTHVHVSAAAARTYQRPSTQLRVYVDEVKQGEFRV